MCNKGALLCQSWKTKVLCPALCRSALSSAPSTSSSSSLNRHLTAFTHVIAIYKIKWWNIQALGSTTTCRAHEQTAAAAASKNAEKGCSHSQQVLGVKKTCHIWNIDVTSRPLARGCADVRQRGTSLFSELSTGKENVPANYCTEHLLRHNANHDDNSRTNWLLCPLPEHNVGPDTAVFKLIYNGPM